MNFKILRKHLYIFFVGLSLIFWRCAQVMPLNGGQRDTQAPKLMESIPKNASLNFTGKTIELKFDEFVLAKTAVRKMLLNLSSPLRLLSMMAPLKRSPFQCPTMPRKILVKKIRSSESVLKSRKYK